jgi:hypothetical protein
MEFLKRKNTLGSRSNSPTRKQSSKLSRSASLSDQPDECEPHTILALIGRSLTLCLTHTVVVVQGPSQASTDTAPLPRAASLVSLHVAQVSNCEGDSSQHLQALRDELALCKAKVETFEARMQDALTRAEQADARLERVAAGCHQDKDAMHKQITALEVAKEMACTREQEAIRRAEEAEVRNAHLVETLAVFQSEVAALKELAVAESTHVPVPLGEEIAAEEQASHDLKIREGKAYLIKSVMTGTVAKVSAIGQSLWAGWPSGGDDEKVCHPVFAFTSAPTHRSRTIVDRRFRFPRGAHTQERSPASICGYSYPRPLGQLHHRTI